MSDENDSIMGTLIGSVLNVLLFCMGLQLFVAVLIWLAAALIEFIRHG